MPAFLKFSKFSPDSTLALLREGYLWFPRRHDHRAGAPVRTRLGGMRVTGLSGSEALRFFYDEDHVRRAGAIPEPVLSTLFGHDAVHTLDGAEHRDRKAMFLSLMSPADVSRLVAETADAWDEAAALWPQRSRLVLFDEVSRVLTRAVCAWAGLQVPSAQVPELASDLVAMVDGFATAGPRHWRARRSRRHRETWLVGVIDQVRSGAVVAPAHSALDVISRHRGLDGELLEPRTAAVELLNILRPTVAVSWFVTFAAHALHLHPQYRTALRSGDLAFATAFTHEVRRFYPFAPFVGGRAVKDLRWKGEPIPAGSTMLVDLYGQNHDEELWPEPYRFRPERFLNREIGAFDLVPQGGGDPATGHRCPGERITIGLLEALSLRLAALDYDVPEQDLSIPANRIPARVSSGFAITRVQVIARPVVK
jgi:fatty-acid peroxygenase